MVIQFRNYFFQCFPHLPTIVICSIQYGMVGSLPLGGYEPTINSNLISGKVIGQYNVHGYFLGGVGAC